MTRGEVWIIALKAMAIGLIVTAYLVHWKVIS